MARSKIIKDIANSDVDTKTALKRAKVLLQELDNREILDWINNEIEGYSSDAKLPNYRMVSGEVKGSCLVGRFNKYMNYKNVPIPLGNVPNDWWDYFHNVPVVMGIDALQQAIGDGKGLEVHIPAEIYPLIAKWNNNPNLNIVSASIELNMPQITGIISKIESRLIDVLLVLERQFGNLDELDIDINGKNEDDKNDIINQIIYIIYNDNSVKIGNNNRVKDATIASTISEQDTRI